MTAYGRMLKKLFITLGTGWGCHARENGYPATRWFSWIPAFAGM